MFEKIKRWYEQGLWNAAQVHSAVEKGILTPAQYEQITGGAR